MNIIILSLLLGTINFVSMGIGNALSRIPTISYGLLKFMLIRNLSTSILLLAVLVFQKDIIKLDWKYVLIALALSVLAYLSLSLNLKALAIGKLGLVSPIISFYVVISLFLTSLFFDVFISPLHYLFVLIIIVGVVLSSINFKDFRSSYFFKSSSGVPYAIASSVCWGVFFFLAQVPTKTIGPYLTALIFEIGMLVWTVIHILIVKEKITAPKTKDLVFIIAVAVLSVIGIVALYVGLGSANIPIVLALSSAAPIVITAYGVLIFKEKLALSQYIAVALVVIGVILLGYLG